MAAVGRFKEDAVASSAPDPVVPTDAEAPTSWKPLALQGLLVAALALTLNLAGNGRISLWDRDEPRYATCVREMIARADWVFPTYNAEPRYHKPVLTYWLMRGAYAIAGDNTFGARLVSAIAGAGTCLLTWWFGRRLLGPKAGLLAGLILATAPIMVAESKLSTTDATLTFFLVGSWIALWELGRKASTVWALVFWTSLALATLTKGPVGPGLIAISLVASWWWGGPTAWRGRLRWKLGLPLFLAITAPWYVAIGFLSHGDFYRVAMGYHVVRRMTTGLEEHGGFPGYYLASTLLTFHPWSALLPAAAYGAWSRRKVDPKFGFLLGWVVGPLILLEAVRTKLLHYYLPAYPACSLLAAWLIVAVAHEGVNLRRWPLGRLSLGLLAGVGLGGAIGLIAAIWFVPSALAWPCGVVGMLMAAGTIFALDRYQRAFTDRATQGLIATWGVVLLLTGAWLLPAAEPLRMSRLVGDRLRSLAVANSATPVMFSFQEPGVVYALGRPAPPMRGRPQLIAQLQRSGAVIAATLPEEERILRADPRFVVEVRDSLRGFNMTKGKTQTLNFVLIRASGSDAFAARPVQQPLVK